jgi:hypothetical protein
MKLKHWNWVFVAILTISALGGAGFLAYRTLYYQPAYIQLQETGNYLPALVPRLVLVIVDGLPYHLAAEMSSMRQVAERGAAARSISVLPSMSQPTWTALVTGARPEISGAALFNAEGDALRAIQVDHLFALVRQTRRVTALAGQDWWRRMIPEEYLDQAHFVPEFDAAGDAEATQAAVDFVRDPEVGFLLLYLGDYDELSDTRGPASAEAQQALRQTDDNLNALLDQVDWSNTVVAIAADHGQLPQGGHGGDERSVLETLFVIAGPRVRQGSFGTIQQPDIAATLSALLGLSLPRSGQGRILYELLDASPFEKARGQVALVAQTIVQADAYMRSIKGETVPAGLRDQTIKLNALLQAARTDEVDRLANSLLDHIALYVEQTRAEKVNRGRLARLPLALVGWVVVVVTFAINWHGGHRAPLLLALLGAAAHHAFWIVRGHVYSLSTLSSAGSPISLAITLAGAAAISLTLGLLVLTLLARLRPRVPPQAGLRLRVPASHSFGDSAFVYCVGVTGFLFAVGLAAYVVNSGLGSWYLVVPRLAFLTLLSWVQTALFGVLSVLGLGLAALGGLLLGKRAASREDAQQ